MVKLIPDQCLGATFATRQEPAEKTWGSDSIPNEMHPLFPPLLGENRQTSVQKTY